jgi:hypothetical protein
MRRRAIAVSLVVFAIAIVLLLKPDRSANGPSAGGGSNAVPASSQVLLFADPREAESSCGCGQIIRMVRGADDPGVVAVMEFDPQRDSEAVRQHAVRVTPTVIIAGADGIEQVRFEGESADVIVGLRGALAALTSATPHPADEGSP